MGFFDFLDKKEDIVLEDFIVGKAKELKLKEFMIEIAINLISKTIAKSEIQVFRLNDDKVIEKTIDDVYYTLNIRPNPNQDGTVFFINLITNLLRDGEALAIRTEDNKLFVADRWSVSDDIIYGKTYYDIYLSDDMGSELHFRKHIKSDDAIYLSLGNSKINKVIDDFWSEYGSMLKASMIGTKKSNYSKFILKLPTSVPQLRNPKTGDKVEVDQYAEHIAGSILEERNSVTPLSSQFELNELGNKQPQKTDDIRNQIKEFGEYVAMAFDIPIDVYFGKKTERASGTTDFITFAVMPIVEIIEDALNAKLIEKDSFLLGENIKFNTLSMQHVDIVNSASSLDKLFSIGFSHNELKELLGMPKVEEEWADRHHVTKNYMNAEEATEEGGE